MNDSLQQLTTIILTGGASTRMGQDKWSLPWPQPKRTKLPTYSTWTMLDEILFKVNEISQLIVVVCSIKQQQEIQLHVQQLNLTDHEILIICDTEQFQGPLYGIYQGLKQLKQKQNLHDWVFVTSCDVPMLNVNVIKVLLAQKSEVVTAIIPRDEKYLYPMCALYHRNVMSPIEKMLEEGQRKMRLLFENVATIYVSTENLKLVDPDLRSLINLNDREIFTYWYDRFCKEQQPLSF